MPDLSRASDAAGAKNSVPTMVLMWCPDRPVVANRWCLTDPPMVFNKNEKEPASMASKLRITKVYETETAADEVLVAKLRAVIDDPKTPPYVLVRAVGSTSAIIDRMDRRRAEYAAAIAARCAQTSYPSILPDNGRSVPGWNR